MVESAHADDAGGRTTSAAYELSTEWFEVPAGERYDSHLHATDQLAWMRTGSLRVTVGSTTWELRAEHAVWIPAGSLHEMSVTGSGTFVDLYADVRLRPSDERWERPAVLTVDPLAASLLEHVAAAPRDLARRQLVYRLLLEVLADAPLRGDVVTLPTDARARQVALALLEDPADPRSLGEWAAALHVSEKTLVRGFVAGTGMTFRDWRLRRRLQAAAGLLVEGTPVGETAERVGYASASAFIASFAEVYGCTPRQYADAARAGGPGGSGAPGVLE